MLKKNPKKLKGKLTVSRTFCGKSEEDHIKIRIQDELSECVIVEAVISFNYFAQAITGLSCASCDVEVYDSENTGKKHEYKTVMVDRLHLPGRERAEEFTDEELGNCIGDFEYDGWIGSIEDMKNSHNLVGIKRDPSKDSSKVKTCSTFRVGFHRWADVEENEDEST